MPEPVFIPDLRQLVKIPEKGIVSRILQDDDQLKVILYGLAAGHQMKLHSAPVTVMLYFADGQATLTLGDATMTARAGAFTHMPAGLQHSIVAETPVTMLLMMVKEQRRESSP